MISSPILLAGLFFGLGLLAGIILASLYYELRSSKRKGSIEETQIKTQEPPNPEVQSIEQSQLPDPLTGTPPELQASPNAADTVDWIRQKPSTASLEQISGITSPKPISANPMNNLIRNIQAATVKDPPKSESMAAAIDSILQEMLPKSALAGRRIRLEEQPGFGLNVVVDGVSYEGVSEVTDDAARELIQKAVAEWQRRAGMGSA